MQPIDNDQSDEKNSNPPFLNVNSARYSIDKWKQKPAIFEQNIAKKSGGSPAVKPPTMHGFKRYNSSANPSDQVFIKDNEQGAAEPEEQLLFTESMIMDYVTLKGIENRFSIKKEEIPVSIFKELLDNALDHVETPAVVKCGRLACFKRGRVHETYGEDSSPQFESLGTLIKHLKSFSLVWLRLLPL